MIFTACTKCDAPIIVAWEAGDEGGRGVFDRQVCDECGAANYVELTSFAGETISEEEAQAKGLKRRMDQ